MSDLSELPSDTIRASLNDVIEKKLKTKNYKVTVTSASKNGENNFIGLVYRIIFQKEEENDNMENPKSKLILKVAPQDEIHRAQVNSRALFLREIYMYDKVFPELQKFEESKGIFNEESALHQYPKCYKTIDEEPSESVFLEDLSVRNFRIIDRFSEDITADHVNLVMQNLAKLHAITLVMKVEQPDKFKKLTSNLKELIVRDDLIMRGYFAQQSKLIFEALASEEDAHLLAKVNKLFEKKDVFDVLAECLDLELTGDASVIQHGDMWQNNTMFMYDDAGKPIEISLVDWQLSRHSSPIIDVVYFIFSNTTKEMRDAHYEQFLKVYHDSLSARVERLGSNADRLFSFELMQEHLHKFAKLALIGAPCILPIILIDGTNEFDSDEIANKKDAVEKDSKDTSEFLPIIVSENSRKKIYKRLHEIAIDMERLGYI